MIESLQAFLRLEADLRAQHGDLALYARPIPLEGGYALAGWAFLDGEPAILPADLDLLVLSFASPQGAMATYPRDPEQVYALLDRYTTVHAHPTPHRAIHVPRAERDGIQQRLSALPDHRPGARAPSPRNAPESTLGFVHPQDLVRVDGKRQLISFSVLVFGSGAWSFARTFADLPSEPSATSLELRLAPVRGWDTRLMVYLFPNSFVGHWITSCDAVVLAQAGTAARIDPAIYALAQNASSSPCLLGMVFPSPAARAEVLQAGIQPDVEVTAPYDAVALLKALTQQLVAQL